MLEQIFATNGHKIIETMTDGLMLVNTSGKILYVNNALEELLHYKKSELIGKSCDILGCDICTRTKRRGRACTLFTKGEEKNQRCSFRRKDGTVVTVLKNATTLKDETDTVVAAVENLTDLSFIEEQDRVITHLKRHIASEEGFQGLIGSSEVMRKIFDLTRSAAQSDAPVIIYGESGTGKKLVASALHRLGTRREGPFVKVNCAALNEDQLERELFGQAKIGFTGADSSVVSRLEAANGGDLFLEEIGDIPPALQIKLLRVLQEHEIESAADHHPVPLQLRIIASTDKNLPKLIKEGRFREELYYRIGVIPINLPPLNERKDDIPALVEFFINSNSIKTGKKIRRISKQALEIIYQYSWPGNVRELINAIDYAFVLCPGDEILPEHLPPHFAAQLKMLNIPVVKSQLSKTEDERQRLVKALKATSGNKSEAARLMGISRVTLWKYLKKYQIEVNRKIQE
ncbi:MAG: sigma 54-interacting transcriptional regulator [Proteobacteria bacterium]|nr:sigma 54-interacting transcriptional regulator [Pseudomonadota bacterium]